MSSYVHEPTCCVIEVKDMKIWKIFCENFDTQIIILLANSDLG